MAMILDAFVSDFCNTLLDIAKKEAIKILGVPDEIKKLQRRLKRISSVLTDAESKRFQNEAIDHWLNELRDLMYDADDIIDECQFEGERLLNSSSRRHMEPVCSCHSPFLCLHKASFRHKIGNKIRALNHKLDELIKDKNGLQLTPTPGDGHCKHGISRKTTPLVEPDLVGEEIEVDTKRLVDLLTKDYKKKISIIAIVGMGGIGKTTLAQKIYNDGMFRDDFKRAWVCVSREFSESDLLRSIIKQVGGDHGEAKEKEVLEPMLSQSLSNKKFFIVLDDIWDAQVWDKLLRKPLQQSGLADGRILITTRHEDTAKQMGAVYIHRVNKLSQEDGWSLISKMVFEEGDEQDMNVLSSIGMKIVEKCDGLPLALRTLGGVLRTKDKRPSEWKKVLSSPAWSFKDLPDEVMGALYLSYQDLPSPLKQCFTLLSLIHEDYEIPQPVFIRFCITLGYVAPQENMFLEDVAEGYWKELVQRSLLESVPLCYDRSHYKMHDLLQSLVQHIAQNECFVGNIEAFRNKIMASSSFIKLRHLFVADENLEAIPDLIMEQTSLRTLRFCTPNVGVLQENLFKKLKYLRILDIGGTSISNLPTSLGDLVCLRCLLLSGTAIRDIPESIANLRNLEFLVLDGCKYLHSLPNGILALINLRFLSVRNVPLDGLPVGLGKLQQLNTLLGFVVNNNCRSRVQRDDKEQEHKEHQQGRFSMLEELKSLSKLKSLELYKLERVLDKAVARAAALVAKSHLRKLHLLCTLPNNFWKMQQPHENMYKEEEIKRIEEIFEELQPPPCLEVLEINGYFGRGFPNWMLTPSSSLLPNLRRLDLFNCALCERLPSLGVLPQLDLLVISSAFAVWTIGPEFFVPVGVIAGATEKNGRKTNSGLSSSSSSYFPKLAELHFREMPNWEEWWWQWEDERDNQTTSLLPSLKKLVIVACPKLRSLPESLLCHATALKILHIKGANCLIEILNIPTLIRLFLTSNSSLERISNFPALKFLHVRDCEKLKHVENVDALEHIKLNDREPGSLPEWLIGAREKELSFSSLQKLTLRDKIYRQGLPDWPLDLTHHPCWSNGSKI